MLSNRVPRIMEHDWKRLGHGGIVLTWALFEGLFGKVRLAVVTQYGIDDLFALGDKVGKYVLSVNSLGNEGFDKFVCLLSIVSHG